jgi:serine/threonine protein kinase
VSVKCAKCNSDNTDTAKFCSECATPLQPTKDIGVTKTIEAPKEDLTTGFTFAGRYQIIEELGKGRMGKVYRVLDRKFNCHFQGPGAFHFFLKDFWTTIADEIGIRNDFISVITS